MQWVKIQIVDKADNARAIVELGSRGRIDCYPDRTYMVPEPALKLLKDLKVTYQELGRGVWIMRKRRYEILLPLMQNDGSPVSPEKLEQTINEVIAEFGALTVAPQAVRGTWVHQGVRYEDQSIRIVVDVRASKASRLFFTKIKPKLVKRFAQLEIYIVSYPVEIH